jgi:hypothetical protein
VLPNRVGVAAVLGLSSGGAFAKGRYSSLVFDYAIKLFIALRNGRKIYPIQGYLGDAKA